MANSDFAIGRLALAELPDAEALVAEAGWNQVAADWRMFLDFGTAYAVRAQGRLIATAAWIPYGACAWISMVLVTAAERRRGLATRLLHRCIADVTTAGLVPVLDATPAGAQGLRAAWVQGGVGICAVCIRAAYRPTRGGLNSDRANCR